MDMPQISECTRQWFEHLMKTSIERVEVAWLKARRDGLEHPTVLVLDLDDPTARKICSTADREDEAERFIANAERQQSAPIMLWHLPGAVAADLLPAEEVRMKQVLNDWSSFCPEDTFPAVVVSEECVALATCHVPKF